MEGASFRRASALRARIEGLYTVEEHGATVLRAADGKPVDTLRAEIAAMLGRDGKLVVEQILGKTDEQHAP